MIDGLLTPARFLFIPSWRWRPAMFCSRDDSEWFARTKTFLSTD
jgi:hypothetical protein